MLEDMARASVPIITFLTLVIIGSCLIHRWLRIYVVAAIVNASLCTILYQILGYFIVGYLDPFWMIALVLGWILAFFMSLIIGLPFLYVRRKRKK